jgi:hypothetical protein
VYGIRFAHNKEGFATGLKITKPQLVPLPLGVVRGGLVGLLHARHPPTPQNAAHWCSACAHLFDGWVAGKQVNFQVAESRLIEPSLTVGLVPRS